MVVGQDGVDEKGDRLHAQTPRGCSHGHLGQSSTFAFEWNERRAVDMTVAVEREQGHECEHDSSVFVSHSAKEVVRKPNPTE